MKNGPGNKFPIIGIIPNVNLFPWDIFTSFISA